MDSSSSCPSEHNSLLSSPAHSPVHYHRNMGAAEDALPGEELGTLITESMSVTSADEEKLLLLNKNTELRRLNKELMKLNEDWDHIYRSTSGDLQQRVRALEEESNSARHLNSRLLLKVENEQSKREYCEQTLLQELKKNQHLQEYIRLLESRLQNTESQRDWPGLALSGTSKPSGRQDLGSSQHLGSSLDGDKRSRAQMNDGDAQKEMRNLKEQLEALHCQTQIYEADYKTEHKDRERMLQENKKLRRKESDMRQQMALLHEQLKVYEDDFRQERSDKQVLQRLLMKKSAPGDPILIHRCNIDHEPPAGVRERPRELGKGGPAQRKRCERHGPRAECRHNARAPRHMGSPATPFSEDYN